MKVLVNAISAKQGGIVTYTHNLIRGMAARGVDAIYAVPENFGITGPNILRLPASEYGPARRLLWEQSVWRAIVSAQRPDVLYSSANFGLFHAPVPQVLLMREAGLFDRYYLSNISPVLGATSVLMLGGRRRLMLASARWADHVLTPSRMMRDLLVEWQPGLGQKTSVLSYGTPREIFQADTRKRTWREGGVLRLIYVSVYYPHKNPGVIGRALEMLAAAGVQSCATITMSADEVRKAPGGKVDWAYIAKPVEKGTLTLSRYPYQTLPGIYDSHDVFVFPSVSESFGHPMSEAMSMGLPMVVADTPINREICGDAALYFSPFKPTELVERLRQLDADPGLRDRLVSVGRQRAAAMYRWDDHVDGLIEILRNVAANRMVGVR